MDTLYTYVVLLTSTTAIKIALFKSMSCYPIFDEDFGWQGAISLKKWHTHDVVGASNTWRSLRIFICRPNLVNICVISPAVSQRRIFIVVAGSGDGGKSRKKNRRISGSTSCCATFEAFFPFQFFNDFMGNCALIALLYIFCLAKKKKSSIQVFSPKNKTRFRSLK